MNEHLKGSGFQTRPECQVRKPQVTKSARKRTHFDYQMSKQPLKNVVSMLIKD